MKILGGGLHSLSVFWFIMYLSKYVTCCHQSSLAVTFSFIRYLLILLNSFIYSVWWLLVLARTVQSVVSCWYYKLATSIQLQLTNAYIFLPANQIQITSLSNCFQELLHNGLLQSDFQQASLQAKIAMKTWQQSVLLGMLNDEFVWSSCSSVMATFSLVRVVCTHDLRDCTRCEFWNLYFTRYGSDAFKVWWDL